MNGPIDQPSPIRQGEELDIERLEAYLKEHIAGLDGPLEIQQFPSGYSNLTYFLKVGDREMVLRRPPFGSKVKSAHDMGREFRVLSGLHPVYPQAPQPLLFCDDEELMGAQFYVMERIRGVILRGKRPEGFTIEEKEIRACCEALVDNLVKLHEIDYTAAGLGDLRREGSYVERQVNGWIDRYYGSQTDDIPSMDQTAEWLKANFPPDSGTALIHNDYKFDNVVLDPRDITRIIGVLDWEMTTIGDPLMDLGTSLGYWLESSDPQMGVVQCFLTTDPAALTRRQFAERYAERTGRSLDNIVFYYVFALFKLAVIVQQIYYRYKQGLTKDDRFAPLIFMVGALGMQAVTTVERQRI
jgi:aminoglycoside phosphotransferase (APT) family kinase protein